MKKRKSKLIEFCNGVIEDAELGDNNCIQWPFARFYSGYGKIAIKGKTTHAHRYICILAHGEPPDGKTDAAHNCGNGHMGCVNPNHLRWATRKENMDDCLKHRTRAMGESASKACLTRDDIIKIRNLRYSASCAEIGRIYGISRQMVSAIQLKKRWAHI